MKRPEKKEISCEDTSYAQLEEIGYNEACDDWEKWLSDKKIVAVDYASGTDITVYPKE